MSLRSFSNIVGCGILVVWLLACSYRTAAQELAVSTRYRLAVAEKKWALDITLPTIELTRSNFNKQLPKSSFTSPIESFAKNGDALLMTWQASRKGTDLHYFLIRVPAAPCSLAATDFRDFVLKQIVKGASDKKYLNYKQVPIATYKTGSVIPWVYDEDGSGQPLIPAAKLSSRNLEAYLVKEDICATLTFTANSFDRDDQNLFYSLLDSVSFSDITNPSTSFDYYQLGRAYQGHKDFKLAAEAFRSALKLEQSQRELNLIRWRHLILDAVEMNKALSNWTEAREVLEYGLSKDSTNTFFLMELARTHASQGDEAKTLAVLEKAFLYMRRGEGPRKKRESGVTVEWSFPDLSKDAAFKQLMKNKSFREAVKAIEKANSR